MRSEIGGDLVASAAADCGDATGDTSTNATNATSLASLAAVGASSSPLAVDSSSVDSVVGAVVVNGGGKAGSAVVGTPTVQRAGPEVATNKLAAATAANGVGSPTNKTKDAVLPNVELGSGGEAGSGVSGDGGLDGDAVAEEEAAFTASTTVVPPRPVAPTPSDNGCRASEENTPPAPGNGKSKSTIQRQPSLKLETTIGLPDASDVNGRVSSSATKAGPVLTSRSSAESALAAVVVAVAEAAVASTSPRTAKAGESLKTTDGYSLVADVASGEAAFISADVCAARGDAMVDLSSEVQKQTSGGSGSPVSSSATPRCGGGGQAEGNDSGVSRIQEAVSERTSPAVSDRSSCSVLSPSKTCGNSASVGIAGSAPALTRDSTAVASKEVHAARGEVSLGPSIKILSTDAEGAAAPDFAGRLTKNNDEGSREADDDGTFANSTMAADDGGSAVKETAARGAASPAACDMGGLVESGEIWRDEVAVAKLGAMRIGSLVRTKTGAVGTVSIVLP